MKKLLLTSMLGAFFCGNAIADDWAWVSVSGDNEYLWLVNNDTIDCEGKMCSAWSSVVNVVPKVRHDLQQVYIEFDCRKKKVRRVYNALFLKGREVHKFPEQATPELAPLGTMIYTALEYVCKKEGPYHDFEGNPFDIVKPAQDFLRKKKKEEKK